MVDCERINSDLHVCHEMLLSTLGGTISGNPLARFTVWIWNRCYFLTPPSMPPLGEARQGPKPASTSHTSVHAALSDPLFLFPVCNLSLIPCFFLHCPLFRRKD